MAIIKSEDIIAWEYEGLITCTEHGEPNPEAEPITQDEIEEMSGDGDIVVCDQCGKRIC